MHPRRPVDEFGRPAQPRGAKVPRDLESHVGGQRQGCAHAQISVQPLPGQPTAPLGVLRTGKLLECRLQPRTLPGPERFRITPGPLERRAVHEGFDGAQHPLQRLLQRGHGKGFHTHEGSFRSREREGRVTWRVGATAPRRIPRGVSWGRVLQLPVAGQRAGQPLHALVDHGRGMGHEGQPHGGLVRVVRVEGGPRDESHAFLHCKW